MVVNSRGTKGHCKWRIGAAAQGRAARGAAGQHRHRGRALRRRPQRKKVVGRRARTRVRPSRPADAAYARGEVADLHRARLGACRIRGHGKGRRPSLEERCQRALEEGCQQSRALASACGRPADAERAAIGPGPLRESTPSRGRAPTRPGESHTTSKVAGAVWGPNALGRKGAQAPNTVRPSLRRRPEGSRRATPASRESTGTRFR